MQQNYFAWQAFGRRYDVGAIEALPAYLRPKSFSVIAERATRVETRLTSVTDFLAHEAAGSADRYVLLDAQDWMSPQQLRGLWQEITRTARPGARVIFRTAGRASPLEAALSPAFPKTWRAETDLATALFRRDRSAIYGGFHIYNYEA